jgi:basic membrane protein A
MAKKTAFLLGIVVILSTLIAACGPTPAPTAQPTAVTPAFKACFVYVGPIGDSGWTWAHDQGRLYLEKTLGVTTAYIESVPEGADAERVIEDYAKQGCNVIFTTSFGYMDPTLAVAQKYPKVFFEHCSGYKTAPNMATYFGRMEQPRYLSGVVAGNMTKSNKIGFVAAFPIPEVVRGINAFTMGVRSVNPNAEVVVVWTNTWYDPVKERQAAEGLLDQGCDVIAQHQDTTEPQKAASERGKFGIGYDADMGKFVGDQVLTSPIWNWGPYYVSTVKAMQDGTWKMHEFYGGFKDGVVDLAPMSPLVPDNVKAQVEAKKQAMIAGTFDPFQGPIYDQQGSLKVPEGTIMTDAEILAFDWFVQGVVGDIPK